VTQRTRRLSDDKPGKYSAAQTGWLRKNHRHNQG